MSAYFIKHKDQFDGLSMEDQDVILQAPASPPAACGRAWQSSSRTARPSGGHLPSARGKTRRRLHNE